MVFVQNAHFLFQTVPHFNIDFQSYMQQVGPRSIISKNYKYTVISYTGPPLKMTMTVTMLTMTV